MGPVQSILPFKAIRQQLSSLSRVHGGPMKTESRIILFIVKCLSPVDHCLLIFRSGYTMDPSETTIIAFSFQPIFQVRLSTPDDQNQTLVHLIARIRDRLDCRNEVNLTSVLIIADTSAITSFIDHLQNSNDDPFIDLLASGSQNLVGQLITSFSQYFNRINNDNLEEARSSPSFLTFEILL